MVKIGKPDESEYGQFFANYVSKVNTDDIVAFLETQLEQFTSTFESVSETDASTIHAPYTWTLKQVVGHLIDGEKIFGYRLHRLACGDETEMPGFDHEPYVNHLDYEDVQIADLVNEFAFLRKSCLLFAKRLKPDHWQRKGTASDSTFSVRGKAYVIAGHVEHHLEIIKNRISV